MKAQLKRLHSPDINLDSYIPENTNNFAFLLQAMIGSNDQEGEDSFDIQVCTIKWLEENFNNETPFWGYGLLIVSEYNLSKIEQKISEYCESCTGDSWEKVARKLSRIGYWEFEDYQPFD